MENGRRTGEVLGKMLTEYSFHDDKGQAVQGAIINSTDQSGENFLNNEIVGGNLGLLSYMSNATGGKTYDFKTRGMNSRPDGMSKDQYKYRGMPLESVVLFGNQDGVSTTFASGRDFGNIGAGFVAGNNGLSWEIARLGFDALQSKQQGRFATEGQPTQRAERVGYNIGIKLYNVRQTEHLWKESTTPFPAGPKY